MKTKFKIIFITFLSIAAMAALLWLNFYFKEQKLLFYATGTNHKAFLNTTWEMSEIEVERANQTKLNKPKPSKFDLSMFPEATPEATLDHRYPKVLQKSRYKTRFQNDIEVWGKLARVNYEFFDDRLFEYSLFFEGYNIDKIHAQILENLSHKYGNGYKKNKEKSSMSILWDTDSVYIDYKFSENEPNEQSKYKLFWIRIRFRYKPMIEKIETISKNEHRNLF